MYKLAVYTICKNELQFINRWINSAKDADYMVVLDTGSTDGTYEKLCELQITYPNLIVEQRIITPWRFDVARNVNLECIPKDTDIFFQVDMDEIITTPNWVNVIKQNWRNDLDQINYMYTWSHTDDGQPETIFSYNKLHGKGWRWEAPVHEMLVKEGRNNTIDIGDALMVEHFPDKTKSRKSYLPLLKQRVAEYPEDYYGKIYLAHEYYYYKNYEESIKYCKELLTKYKEHYDILEIADLNCCIARNYIGLKDYYSAIRYADESIKILPTLRDSYLLKADSLINMKFYSEAISVLDSCQKNSFCMRSWLESPGSWTYKIWDLYCLAYYYSGNKIASLGSALRAYEYNKKDERLKENVDVILKQIE